MSSLGFPKPTLKLQDIVLSHLSRYPLAQLEDLYKLYYQASLVSEYALKDVETAREWLNEELDQLGLNQNEPLLETISPDDRIGRVHLPPSTILSSIARYTSRAIEW